MTGKNLQETLFVEFTKAETPTTPAERDLYDEKEQALAELRAQMEQVRKQAKQSSDKAVRVRAELSPAQIRETRDYCKAVEDPMATRVIQAQIDRCREFRRDYPLGRYPDRE
jgi:hypothetical protein